MAGSQSCRLFTRTNGEEGTKTGRNGWLGYLGSPASKWTLLIKSGSYRSLGLLVLAPSVTPGVLQVSLSYPGCRGVTVRSTQRRTRQKCREFASVDVQMG